MKGTSLPGLPGVGFQHKHVDWLFDMWPNIKDQRENIQEGRKADGKIRMQHWMRNPKQGCVLNPLGLKSISPPSPCFLIRLFRSVRLFKEGIGERH